MKRSRSKNNLTASEQAADWLIELSEPSGEETSRRQFLSWLKRSPQNVEEFLAIAVLHQEVAEQASSVAELVAEASSLRNQPAVPIFAEPATPDVRAARSPSRRPRYALWASAAGFAIAAFLLLQRPFEDPPFVTHRTELGEQRSVALADGSIVTLNTLSEATVRFDRSTREVTLVSGEAMFDVASDPDRPFVVHTGSMSMTAIGTRFVVYRKRNSTRLAVVEGVVEAVPNRFPGQALLVEAGRGVVATTEGLVFTDARFDVETAIAWTDRRLIFDGAPLAEVVGEFNRYNRTPLVIEDTELANRAITTVFNAHDVGALIGFLQLEPDVEVEYGDDAVRIRVRH
jgi:transmembrane sensor